MLTVFKYLYRQSFKRIIGGVILATYSEIQDWVKQNDGWKPKTCWIAHCKELKGLPVKKAANRKGNKLLVPCPENKRIAIEAAFRHFGMI